MRKYISNIFLSKLTHYELKSHCLYIEKHGKTIYTQSSTNDKIIIRSIINDQKKQIDHIVNELDITKFKKMNPFITRPSLTLMYLYDFDKDREKMKLMNKITTFHKWIIEVEKK